MGAEPSPLIGTGYGIGQGIGSTVPGPMQSQAARPSEPTAGGEELARLEHLVSTVAEHVERLDNRLQRVLAQPTPQPAPPTAVERPSRSDGAPGSLLAEQLHDLNDRLALIARRLADFGDRVDV